MYTIMRVRKSRVHRLTDLQLSTGLAPGTPQVLKVNRQEKPSHFWQGDGKSNYFEIALNIFNLKGLLSKEKVLYQSLI